MWEPPYRREGQPVTADDPNPNTPLGQYEGEMRFVWGLKGSRQQRRAARILLGGIAILALLVGAVALVFSVR
jgi:hypothetical protein